MSMTVIAAVTLAAILVASTFIGWVSTKRLLHHPYAETFEALGQKDLARELRAEDDPPVKLLAALWGALVGLLIGFFLPLVGVALGDEDFYVHRMTQFHLIYGGAIFGGVVALIAGKIVQRRS